MYSTAEVARMASVHRDTLLRWLRARVVPEPQRDRHGWRLFTNEEAKAVVGYATQTTPALPSVERQLSQIDGLKEMDWDFENAKTSYLTHGIHPYPAKFIPQIPNALIQELSSVGDTVADIFCGSGTSLVEALTLKRHAVGIDANPLACLISGAKTNPVTDVDVEELTRLVSKSVQLADRISVANEGGLFPPEKFASNGRRPASDTLEFWFEPFVIEELAEILAWCRGLSSGASRDLALTAFSSIVVAVSRQDSDTRYVRRDKNLTPSESFRRFARSLEQAIRVAIEFSEIVEPRFTCRVISENLLKEPDMPPVDLVVCSPPYPNAYSYHLYHMTRMLWLGMDQPKFKQEEIGSHRKYSSNSKHAANEETFLREFETIMGWLGRKLRVGGSACFVVGDSTLKGRKINNANLIVRAARSAGFAEVARIERTLQTTKKAFNPSIGKIKTENVLILENRGRA